MKIAIIQPLINDHCDPQLDDITSLIKTVADENARLVVFPEAYLTGYVLSEQAAREQALSPDSAVLKHLEKLSQEHAIHIVIGALTSDAHQQTLKNSALCFHPGGKIEQYHKSTPLWLEVDRYCETGDAPFLMFCIDDIWFAVMICYDLSNPFGVYAAALSGADVMLVPTNWPLPSLSTTADFTIRARAYESKVYIAASNKIGVENGILFCGSSCVVAPSGQFIAKAAQFDDQESVGSLTQQNQIIYADVAKTEKVKSLGDDYIISSHDPRLDLLLPILEEKIDQSQTSHAIAKSRGLDK